MAFMTGDASPWDIDDLMSRRGAGTPRFINFPAIAAAYGDIGNAAGPPTIAMITDSTGAGCGSNGAPGGAGVSNDAANYRRARSWPYLLGLFMESRGIPIRMDGVFGAGATAANTAAEFMAAVPWVTMGAGWGLSAVVSAGGRMFENTTTTNPWTITPQKPANRFIIRYQSTAGFDVMNVSDSSGSLGTMDANTGNAVRTATFNRSVASLDPVNIARTAVGGTARIISVICRDTTDPMVEIWNMGWPGAQTSNWISTSGPQAPLNAMASFVATQCIVELGANDINAGVSAATYGANMRTLVDQLITNGSTVSLATPPASRDVGSPYNIPQTYVDQLTAIKAERPALTSTFDFRSLTYQTTDYFDSSVHMTKAGYLKRAREAIRMLA